MMTPHALTILLPLILLSALSTHASGQTDKPMTNQDVIKLVKLGLSPEIIIKKIEDSPPAYDLGIDGLTLLAQNRVPNEGIKAMQAAVTCQQRSSPPGTSVGARSMSTSVGSDTRGLAIKTPNQVFFDSQPVALVAEFAFERSNP